MRNLHGICTGALVGFSLSNLMLSGMNVASIALIIVSLVNMITWFAFLYQVRYGLKNG